MRKSMLLLSKEIRFVLQRIALIRKRRVAFKSRKVELLPSSLWRTHVADVEKIIFIDLSEKTRLFRNHHPSICSKTTLAC